MCLLYQHQTLVLSSEVERSLQKNILQNVFLNSVLSKRLSKHCGISILQKSNNRPTVLTNVRMQITSVDPI